MAPRRRRIEVLPADVLALLLRYLTGFDLLPLSQVSRRFFYDLLGANSVAWASRLPSKAFIGGHTASPSHDTAIWKVKYKTLFKDLFRSQSRQRPSCSDQRSWKELYFRSSSFRFPGCRQGPVVERVQGGALKLWDGLAHTWNADAFSFDLWFALVPGPGSIYTGGILFGAQSVEWPGARWGSDCQQFVHLDPDGNLFCSMTTDKPVIATKLKLHRWHHVALSLERLPHNWWMPKQCVYLDGELVHESQGSVPAKWRYLNHAQIGSGVIDGESVGAPSAQHRAWYGFNGLVDAFRFWNGVLSMEDVQQLTQDQEASVEERISCAWSLRHAEMVAVYGDSVTRVSSTRPRERLCVLGKSR